MKTLISRRGLVASTLALILLCFTGCGAAGNTNEKPYSREQIIAAQVHISYAALKSKSNTIIVNDKHARADCPTGGWVTHGDGHKTRCPSCDPPYLATDEAPVVVEERKEVPIPPAPAKVQPQTKPQVQPKVIEQKKVQYYDQRTRRWYYYYVK